MKIEKELTTPTQEWKFTNLDETAQFATDLLNVISDTPYYGISANECGSNYRVLALKAEPESFVCFNPSVMLMTNDTTVLEEVSPHNPGLTVKVRRVKQIRARFYGPDGNIYAKTFTGLTARIYLQLLDNLNGVEFFNKASLYHRELGFKKLKREINIE